jgi:hypothetical protein
LKELEEYIKFMNPLKIPLRFLIPRGNNYGVYKLPKHIWSGIDPVDKKSTNLDIDELEEAFLMIDNLNTTLPYRFWSSNDRRKNSISLEMIRSRNSRLRCHAGKYEAALYSDGSLAM